MIISEQLYETACGKIAEYAKRKRAIMDYAMNSVPEEMTGTDRNILLDFLHDGLNDAYSDLIRDCNAIIEAYESRDRMDMIKELGTIGV